MEVTWCLTTKSQMPREHWLAVAENIISKAGPTDLEGALNSCARWGGCPGITPRLTPDSQRSGPEKETEKCPWQKAAMATLGS